MAVDQREHPGNVQRGWGEVMSLIAAGASTAASFGAAIIAAVFLGVPLVLFLADPRRWR